MAYNCLAVKVAKDAFTKDPVKTLITIEREAKNELININVSELNKMDMVMGVVREPYKAYDQVKIEVDKMGVPFPKARIGQDEDYLMLTFSIEAQITPLPRYRFKGVEG